MMGREKEMSTAITWKANEDWVPALLASARGRWISQRPWRGWANTVDCVACGGMSSASCGGWGVAASVDAAAAAPRHQHALGFL